jgi:hypothetical protein
MIIDMIEQTPEYRRTNTQRQGRGSSARTDGGGPQAGTHVGPSSGPNVDAVLSFEKGDIEFWLRIAQVVLLFLIWREVSQR